MGLHSMSWAEAEKGGRGGEGREGEGGGEESGGVGDFKSLIVSNSEIKYS